MPASTAGEFLTVQEAAKLLKMSPVTIKRWLKQGRLRAYHVGPRAIRIKQGDIEALLTPTEVATERTEHKEAPMSLSQTHEHNRMHRPQPAELARRQQLVATIRDRRQERIIAPMTAAQLVQAARRERERTHAIE